MKIGEQQPPATDTQVGKGNSGTAPKSEKGDASPFSRVLAKKRDPGEDQKETPFGQGGKRGDADASTAFSLPQPPPDSGQMIQPTPTPVENRQIVTIPVELQQVVREISTEINTAGNHQVNIELNSKVLGGLRVQIERQQGAVAIQFQAATDQVAALVSSNLASLSEALADRGVNVSNIRVAKSGESSQTRDFRNPSASGQQSTGGRSSGGR